jgi:nucleotide-binding universal stress UspA family protein
VSKVRNYPAIPTQILLPIDFSASSQAALYVAADLARHFNAQLHLLNVLPEFPMTTAYDTFKENEVVEEARDYAGEQLSAYKEILVSKGVDASFLVESGSDVADKIVAVIDRENIDLLVISTHGISGWRPMMFGSIAEKIVKTVECPLLLLRSNEERDAA